MAVIDAPAEAVRPRPAPWARTPDRPEATTATVHRVLSVVGTLSVLWALFNAWSSIVAVPQTGAAVIGLAGGALVLACLIARAPTSADLARLDRWMLALGLLALLARAASALASTSGYSTDEAAFTQNAVQVMLHGHNPYSADLAHSLYTYAVPGRFWTYLTNGGFVSSFGYPSLSLLLVAPFVWLTGNGQAVPVAYVCALMALTVIVYRLLPRHLRGLAVITCVGLPTLLGFALSGLNIVLMLPFLVLALRLGPVAAIGRPGRRATALGLAMSVNPLAWILAPFIVAPELHSEWRRGGAPAAGRHLVRYGRYAGAAFGLVNLPFIIAGPGAWLDGVLAPLTQHALPYGQGLVGISAFLGVGGGAVDAYGLAGIAAYVALLATFVWRIDDLEPAALLLPLLALFVSGRSLGEYWMAVVPAVAVGLLAPRPARTRDPLSRRSWLGIAALFLPATAALGVAFATPAPLSIHVVSARSSSRTDQVISLRIEVENRSSKWMRPFYSTNSRGEASTFWSVIRGPRRLAPGARALIVLRAPDTSVGPSNGSRFVVQAVTDEPRTVSISARFVQLGEIPNQPS